MVDFGGWDMPLHYGSQVDEHHAVRNSAGMFDVSHMTVVDVTGPQREPFLRHLLSQDVAKIEKVNSARYALMLNEKGGVVDDLIVYRLANSYRLIVNAATRDKDLKWMRKAAEPFDCTISERDTLAIVAVQGPKARALCDPLLKCLIQEPLQLSPFTAHIGESDIMVARTGYTGEDGYEIILPNEQVLALFDALIEAGVSPCGLGARDTLRLEAGMCLYGQDLDDDHTPYSANLGWAVDTRDTARHFLGRKALEDTAVSKQYTLLGLVLPKGGIMRHGMNVFIEMPEQAALGVVTSGGFSPSLKQSIALARVDRKLLKDHPNAAISVEIRGKQKAVRAGKPVFYRSGEPCFTPRK